ncbi:MAG: hypothetical protein CMK30_07860 [Porticoccaceae bacterium]|nr:hypothetical protein [Porticoccaceae bacterium]|tara:strand:+ start:12736 stop:13857 length:1122 start_codon:yes stop_codon:yes gene_type:complete
MSLIPEKQIVISPTLAATIGLHETIMLQLLQECKMHSSPQVHGGLQWTDVHLKQLSKLAPFWSKAEIHRLSFNLAEKGVIILKNDPNNDEQALCFAFNEPVTEIRSNVSKNNYRVKENTITSARADLIKNDWYPSEDALRQLSQLGATREFALQQVPQFVAYWRDKKVPRYSWESKYLKEVWRQWQKLEANNQLRSQQIAIDREWRPSEDAMQILTDKGGISANFVEDAVPEFILYWRERGGVSNTWDTKFIHHVRRQWQFFVGMTERELQPKPITSAWRPKESVYDVLNMANIDRQFAEALLPEFILYWQENGALQSSWSTKFLQYIKGQWARESQTKSLENGYERQIKNDRKGRLRDRSIIDALSDRSWAT